MELLGENLGNGNQTTASVVTPSYAVKLETPFSSAVSTPAMEPSPRKLVETTFSEASSAGIALIIKGQTTPSNHDAFSGGSFSNKSRKNPIKTEHSPYRDKIEKTNSQSGLDAVLGSKLNVMSSNHETQLSSRLGSVSFRWEKK